MDVEATIAALDRGETRVAEKVDGDWRVNEDAKAAILGAGVVITASVPIIDVTGAEPVEHRGIVPPRAVVVPGVRQRAFPAGGYGLPTPLIVGWRDESHNRMSLNDVLREFEIGS